jgi:chromosome segregation ATPase
MSAANPNYNCSVDVLANVNVDRCELTEEKLASQEQISVSIEKRSERFVDDRHECLESNAIQNQIDWSDRAYKLRQKNLDFCKKISQLEQTLAESQEQLLSEQKRAQNAEIFIARQTEEVGSVQQKYNSLLQKLESARQEVKNKQVTIDNIYAKLAASQEHVARIERECAILQENYHEQQYKLLEAEQQAKELNIRLEQQQRYTLEYKTALNRQAENTAAQNKLDRQLDKLDSTGFTSKIQPIQSWSLAEGEMNYLAELNSQPSIKLEPENKVRAVNQDAQAAIVPELPFNEENQGLVQKAKSSNTRNSGTNRQEQVISSSAGNSISPVIAAAASNRKRKSLAAIDLPTFPRYRAY